MCEDGFLNNHQYETHFESNHDGMKKHHSMMKRNHFNAIFVTVILLQKKIEKNT
jgi:hypothetical protein